MRRQPRSIPSLADYRVAKLVSTNDPDLWATIGRWQRDGMVTVKPITRQSATVEVTDAGRLAAERLP